MTSPMIPSPTGYTRLYVTLGHPVSQVKSPEVLNVIFASANVDAVMLPVEVHPDDLAATMEGLKRVRNLDGMLITVPHKFAVVPHLDHMSAMVELAGAVNALRREPDGRWKGDNFDGRGFVAGLNKQGHTVEGRTIVLVGAGGAGAAIAPALLEAGAAHLQLVDLDEQKASSLASRLLQVWPGTVDIAQRATLDGADIVVNATPLGLRNDDPLPFDPSKVSGETVVADIIMKPTETRLLKEAAEAGLVTHAGIHMLDGQIALYRQFFGF